MADTTAQKGVDPGHQLRVVPHVMACFATVSRLHESLGEIAQDILAMVDRIEDFLYRNGRWSEAYEI